MKMIGTLFLILVTIEFFLTQQVQNQINGSENIDSATHMNLSNEQGDKNYANSNSKYIEIWPYIQYLSNNGIIRLIDLKNRWNYYF